MRKFGVNNIQGREPLQDYPWRPEIDKLLLWLQNKNPHTKAFCFDLIMSAAYIDATSGVEQAIERCDSITENTMHMQVSSIFARHVIYINRHGLTKNQYQIQQL